MKTQSSLLLAIFASLTLAAGCSTSGGKQEPLLNHESSSRDLKGNVSDVSSRAQDVFKDMGIALTGTQTKDSGKEEDLSGKAADKTVTVKMIDLGQGMTHVDVVAKNGAFQWNEDYANQVLAKLIEKS